MTAAVITFPGSNCDRDMAVALEQVTGRSPVRLWHRDTQVPRHVDMIAVPGGFSYGDYLRSGALAARSPIMRAVAEAAARGVPVLGVCNGFQILCEAGLLPGALLRNAGQTFICRTAELEVASTASVFTADLEVGETLRIPVAHHDGNFFAAEEVLDRLEQSGRVVLRYVDNLNGSRRAIAGVANEAGNVVGMMPHPERAVDAAHGGTDGLKLLRHCAALALG
ncbi:phosphoribosylformylglycinamidine synthase subunit PurQ [Erythrobacteraceae bacterium CFH 75059]|uniref:phosphoribosylformylglycinamidine synthase subunit PurQ n=1 Tax=Qipengyuania thermophila TaxID=2509361 RepID=UPI001020D0B6|nr:phosphoribosylformylglycinamidine synthase subunit PurQ [Qipengyuania thermophila]TCD04912.1 phosphoribosylformylglycinamidine synthase subunit PurQ [Erythrobacteraceae bacterium CFH 75059]